jgi:hypothetical protein
LPSDCPVSVADLQQAHDNGLDWKVEFAFAVRGKANKWMVHLGSKQLFVQGASEDDWSYLYSLRIPPDSQCPVDMIAAEWGHVQAAELDGMWLWPDENGGLSRLITLADVAEM